MGIDIKVGTNIGKGLCVAHCGGIVINPSSTLGDNCIVYQGVTIGGMTKHGKQLVPRIGDNVVIFAGAKIIGDVKIGNNVVVGANAVVTHDVPDNAIVAGIPARVLSMNGAEYVAQYQQGG